MISSFVSNGHVSCRYVRATCPCERWAGGVPSCLKNTKVIINAEREEWELFQRQKALYNSFHNDMKHKAVKNINVNVLMDGVL